MNTKAISIPRPEFQHVADRINDRTDRSGECWLWTGSLHTDGYALTSFKGKTTGVHRLAYEAYVGPIPEGLEIDHLCRVRRCVNPAHLEAVTHKVNMQRRDYSPASKTHCKNGHPFDEANTRVRDGKRVCRTCRRAVSQRHREKLAEKAKQSQQAAPATALAQLIAGHPELPKVAWHLTADGHLAGSAMQMTKDPRQAMTAYVEVLGGESREVWPAEGSESQTFSTWLHVTWRDVPLSIWLGCDVALVFNASVVSL